MWQNNFFLVCFNSSHAFDFRLRFAKTLVAFNFDEKLTQNVECRASKNIELKNVAVKIPNLILFHFCSFCWLPSTSIVAASYFSYLGPFNMV